MRRQTLRGWGDGRNGLFLQLSVLWEALCPPKCDSYKNFWKKGKCSEIKSRRHSVIRTVSVKLAGLWESFAFFYSLACIKHKTKWYFLHRLHIGTQHAVLENILMIAGCADQISLEHLGKKSASQFISRETAGMKRGIRRMLKRREKEKIS